MKILFLKDHPMPMPPMRYPSFWLYLEDYKEEFANRILNWLKHKEIPTAGYKIKSNLLLYFSDLTDELRICFKNSISEDCLNELKTVIEQAFILIYYSGDNPQIYSDRENLLLRAKEVIIAVIDEHVENKVYIQGEDDEYPQTKL